MTSGLAKLAQRGRSKAKTVKDASKVFVGDEKKSAKEENEVDGEVQEQKEE